MPRVICVADNFPKPTGRSTVPLVFLKDGLGAYGDGDLVRLPDSGDSYWAEPELGFVLARRGHRIPRETAPTFIDRYVIVNDVTRDSPAGYEHHLMYSKAFAGSLVIGKAAGPEFSVNAASVRGYHNGVLLREGVLSARLFDESFLISWLSSWCMLEAGDIVVTGTPNRVRARQYLAEGDEFVCEIDGIGRLVNRFSFHWDS